jgi:hypothetical protein
MNAGKRAFLKSAGYSFMLPLHLCLGVLTSRQTHALYMGKEKHEYFYELHDNFNADHNSHTRAHTDDEYFSTRK